MSINTRTLTVIRLFRLIVAVPFTRRTMRFINSSHGNSYLGSSRSLPVDSKKCRLRMMPPLHNTTTTSTTTTTTTATAGAPSRAVVSPSPPILDPYLSCRPAFRDALNTAASTSPICGRKGGRGEGRGGGGRETSHASKTTKNRPVHQQRKTLKKGHSREKQNKAKWCE